MQNDNGMTLNMTIEGIIYDNAAEYSIITVKSRQRVSCGNISEKGDISKRRSITCTTGDKLYACEQCDKQFMRLSSLRDHAKEHAPEKPYYCAECDMGFVYASIFRRHMVKHNNGISTPYLCSVCAKLFSNVDSLRQHVQRTHSTERPYACDKCNKTYKKISELKDHMRKHTGERPFSCEKCCKSFGLKSSLYAHNLTRAHKLGKRSEKKNFSCEQCGVSFKTLSTLTRHVSNTCRTEAPNAGKEIRHLRDNCAQGFTNAVALQVHHVNCCVPNTSNLLLQNKKCRPYVCPICLHGLSNPRSFRVHISNHSDKKPYKCASCSRSYLFLVELEQHMRRHTGERPYSCETCGSGFMRMSSLQSHLRLHRGLKSRDMPLDKHFRCQHCEKPFRRMCEVKKHINAVHLGLRPYVCEMCTASFTTKEGLQRHFRNHSGEKPYRCEHCGKGFGEPLYLRLHMQRHTDEKHVLCEVCSRAFSDYHSLKVHMVTHASVKPHECEVCHKRFSRTNTLRHHQALFHMDLEKMLGKAEPLIKCNQCDKCFVGKHSLMQHMAKHSTDRQFKCEQCIAAFKHCCSLQKHIQSAHFGDKPFACEICRKSFSTKAAMRRHTKIHVIDTDISEHNNHYESQMNNTSVDIDKESKSLISIGSTANNKTEKM